MILDTPQETRLRRIALFAFLVLTPFSLAMARVHDVGQNFTTYDRIAHLSDGQAAGMKTAGWLLIGLGLALGTAWEQLKVFRGQAPQPGAVVVRALIAAAVLGSYGPLCKTIWNITAELGISIQSDADKLDLALGMKVIFTQVITALKVDNVLFAPISIVRNGILSWFVAFLGWFLVWAVDAIRVAQVVVFNVVYAFGPIALGLYVFGLRTGEIWMTALLEICSWNITMAIVGATFQNRIARLLLDLAGAGALETDWWTDMKEVTFLSSLILFVPVLTSRFFGFSALGQLSQTTLGSSTAMGIATTLQSWGSFSSAPQMQGGGSQSDDSNNRRPGD